MSAIYCAHLTALPYGHGGYLVCSLCGKEWYGALDAAPLVVIGFTTKAEVDLYPHLVELRKRRDK